MADGKAKFKTLHLEKRLPVDLEFTDLTYSVPISTSRNKIILRNISGYFKSGELTAILGPSGAGKSTLLNILAGYNVSDGSGSILVNGEQRDMTIFRKLSRYIMQEDVHHPCFTVLEYIKTAAKLKLGNSVSEEQKMKQIMEILDLLRLTNAKNTLTQHLSGGEKKRLSIALELVNNPPVIFLDEPTTGLDDLASSQCIELLKSLAIGGRTIICSIHTPSAKLFALFDNVFIVSEGQCVFQGKGEHIVPFLAQFGLKCPVTYNPADFVIEVSVGEYGNYHESMTRAISNGKVHRWSATQAVKLQSKQEIFEDIKEMPDYGCGSWEQFVILLTRMFTQLFRDPNVIILKTVIYMLIGVVVGGVYYQFGDDAALTIFNFGFCFVTIVVFLYIPMLPAIVWFPQEVKSIKREYFNRWYGLNSYFFALSLSRLPLQIIHGMIYIIITYIMTGQPMEWERFTKFSFILALVCLISEALGMAISAGLNIVNGIFVGPCLSVPLMLLAVYGMGSSIETVPLWIQISMHGSFLRFGLEGLIMAIYGNNRKNMICPPEEIYCQYTSPKILIKEVGMERADFWFDICALVFYLFLFKVLCYFILRQRLKRTKSSGLAYIARRFIKRYFNLSR